MTCALISAIPWHAHPSAAPVTRQEGDDRFAAVGNGTRICSGGWQFAFETPEDKVVEVAVDAECRGLVSSRESLLFTVLWDRDIPTDSSTVSSLIVRDYLLPDENASESDRARFRRTLTVPDGATGLTVRCALRWTATGTVVWSVPRIKATIPSRTTPVQINVAVVTGRYLGKPKAKTVADNLAYYGRLCEEAAESCQPDLIAVPELAIQWGVPGHAIDLAVPVPGEETEVFSGIARRHNTRIVLGVYERAGDAVYNSAVLLAPSGETEAIYRKVHLAAGGEDHSGIMPGDTFPVADTPIGRIGFNICMDSSATESSRMVGLNGADFLVLPIMGDHRASRWNPGTPIFNESRWKAIMRTRAMDNQLCMVVARNTVQGSCIVDRRGDVLAWNEGDVEFISASVPTDDGYRSWNGACFRGINWNQRRPHLYEAFTDVRNYGSLE